MPVLKIYFERLSRMTGLSSERILDRLPYLGLDIESVESDSVRIEYNPNRADFSSDYGIARALRGLAGVEMGPPTYPVASGRIRVSVDEKLAEIRPYIACAAAKGLRLDDETVRQLISMQEDLHNGIGRKRKRVSIGLHNLDAISPPIAYRAVTNSFRFTPLSSTTKMSIRAILENTETGIAYGGILEGASGYPILEDSRQMVLSFPPIINGTDTKIDAETKNLFIDVTSIDERVGDEALAIVCSALGDAGGAIESVSVDYPRTSRITPNLSPTTMKLDVELTSAITGLDLTRSQMGDCLGRSRIGLVKRSAVIPRYRVDILHPVDLAEEVAIGYGLDRIRPDYPPSKEPGSFDRRIVVSDGVAESMSMAGFIETVNYDLVDYNSLYDSFQRPSERKIEVENPRSIEHSLLRDSLLPSLMSVLSRNTKAVYPQRIFEVGRVFLSEGNAILEREHLAALVAHSTSYFSETKMYLETLIGEKLGLDLVTRVASHWAFAKGRSAEVLVQGRSIGYVGELSPKAVASFGLEVPVTGFEIDLAAFV